MFDLKNLARAITQVAEEKGIDAEKVLEAVESSIAAAYKKEYEKKGEVVKSKLNVKTGEMKFWQVKTVADETTVDMTPVEEVEEETAKKEGEVKREVAPVVEDVDKLPRYNPDRHILIEEAKKIKKDAELGEELTFPLETKEDFGRIAAQTAKQVILQKLREAERESILKEFASKEGDIVSGIIQRIERRNVFVDLGRAIGVMFYNEAIPTEHYRVGDRMRFYVLAVQDDAKLPGIVLSRAHPKFISKLFGIEVPEITDGSVEIKAIAREPGSRTKVAVTSNAPGIDPVGSCVGQRGTRVMALSNELGQEKIDIIEWSEESQKFLANSLSPAKVARVEVVTNNEARVYVPDEQLSLAIGKGGQNVRLAAKLTGWKIDVRSEAKPQVSQAEGVAEALAPMPETGDVKKAEIKSEENK